MSEPRELDGRVIRTRTLDLMTSILLESSFPSEVSEKADQDLVDVKLFNCMHLVLIMYGINLSSYEMLFSIRINLFHPF